MMNQLGSMLLILGGVLAILGLLLLWGVKVPFFGKLPGDIFIDRGNVKVFIPLTSSILISIIFTFILSLFRR